MTRSRFPDLRLAPALVTLALGSGVGTALQEAEPRVPAAQTEDRTLPAAERVLEFASGDFLRAHARRLADGRWQWRSDGTWSDLPGVAHAAEERELLAQARQLEREAGSEPVRRVALADWMARRGLAEEALRELDSLLGEHPAQADALRLLAKPPRALDLLRRREDGGELFDLAARGGPALRELALTRLAEVDSEAVLFERLRAGLGSHSVRARAASAAGLARRFPGEELRGLATRSVLDGSEDVRREAALALAAAGEPAVILPLVRALGSEHGAVRSNAVRALGRAGYAAAVAPLATHLANLQTGGGGGRAPAANIFVGSQLAHIQDFDVEVASGAAISDPTVNVLTEGAVLDARVQSVTAHRVATERRYVREALGRLTGADPGSTDRAWLDWWSEAGEDWP